MANLLNEAIADAKLIKELAIENAKTTLAETFAPQIKSMLAAKLQEDEDVSGLFEEEDEDLEDEAPEKMKEADEAPEDDEVEDTNEDLDLDEIIRELEEQLEEGDEENEEDLDGLGEAEDMEDDEEVEEGKITREQLEGYLTEILAEMDDTGDDEDEDEAPKKKAPVEESRQIAKLKSDLAEAHKTIKSLHGVLKEAVLINSKLKFSGKIFRSNDYLLESQKLSILESFDRAKTVREAKLLYTTISTTLREAKVKKPVKSLKESRASRGTLNSTKPATQILAEDSVVSRLKQLAGII